MRIDLYSLLAIPVLMLAAPVTPSAGTAAVPPVDNPRGTLCARGEVVIFHRGIGRKMVSVCGNRRPTPLVQYRFGTPGDIELAYPGPGQSPGGLTWALMGFAGGAAQQIRFSNGGYDYAVDDRTIRIGFDRRRRPIRESSAGVMVMRGGRLLSHRACTTPPRSDARARDFMAQGIFMD